MNKFFTLVFLSFNLAIHAQENIGLYSNPTVDISDIDVWFNYSAGLKGKFHLKNKTSLRASIGYEHNKYTFPNVIRVLNEYFPYYMDVQLIKAECHIRFDQLNKENKISFYTFVGPTINTCFSEKSDLGLFYGGIIDNRKVRLYNALLTAGLGLGVPIIHQLIIEIEPSCAIAVWTDKSAAANVHYPRIGLNLGLTYKLRN